VSLYLNGSDIGVPADPLASAPVKGVAV